MVGHRELTVDGIHFHVLSVCTGGSVREIRVAPDYGMNLCRFVVDGHCIIDYEPEAVKHDFSGTPLLYPTPNRVFHGVFRHDGTEYPQVKRGKRILSHGLMYDEPFDGVRVTEAGESISISAHKDFTSGDGLYEAFPFRHRLEVSYTLSAEGVRFDYTIQNLDIKPLPYGIALHPYFIKLDGEEGTQLRAPFTHAYENIKEDLIPTGKLLDIQGTALDISSWRSVGSLDLDTVYTGNTGGHAAIRYTRLGLEVKLVASPEFTHMVVYTPPGAPFFCMENQSCATDAHNLYEKGFREESGLRFVAAGGSIGGFIEYQLAHLA